MAVMKRALGLIATATLVVGLGAGCGSDDGDGVATDGSATPSASESTSESPAPDESTAPAEPSKPTAAPASWQTCADVWREGADLPKPYPGCARDGLAVPAKSIHCSMGALLVTYDDKFWGVPGHEISRADGGLQKDPDFQEDRATCTA